MNELAKKQEIKMYRTENLYDDEYGIYNSFVMCESKELALQLIKDYMIIHHKEDLDDKMIIMPTIEMIYEVPKNEIYNIYYTE